MNPIICELNKKQKDNDNPVNRPIFGTLEWASSNANFINGCKHDCKYCYSKSMAIRFKRKNKNNWRNEQVRHNCFLKNYKKIDGTIMVPSSHDIHPDNLDFALKFFKKVLLPGNNILIVTKPHILCIKAICDKFSKFKDRILFRFTVGSSSSKVLNFWEPYAPPFEERINSLKHAYYQGFNTSISCEPMLDNNVGSVIEETEPYVTDSIWIGKANALIGRLRINGVIDKQTMDKANVLLNWQSDENILKLYKKFKTNTKIKWKESIKSVVGIEIPTIKGLDI